MRRVRSLLIVLLSGAALATAGCEDPRGKPGPEPEVPRPDQVLDFATLYKQNCVSCHGDNHEAGAAISLTNPVFLAVAGKDNLKNVIANGVSGKLMPPFAQSAGGMLTDQQVEILASGLVSTWGKPGILDGQNAPSYKATLHPDAENGQQPYAAYCARCHGAAGEGTANPPVGSIVNASYLALISDQELRNFVIAGAPGMPDWRGDNPGHPMSDEDVTGVVTWLGSHRNAASALSTPATATSESGPKPHAAAKAAHGPVPTPQETRP